MSGSATSAPVRDGGKGAKGFGGAVHRYASVDSTMRVAAELALEGCVEGTAVSADRQTAGRGRLGRKWHSEAGQGVYLSVVLRPDCAPVRAPLLTLVAGLAAKQALEQVAGVECDIRWPNDILIGGRKCCGILVEMECSADRVTHVIVGIGVNANHLTFPDELAGLATSLRIETGRRWSRRAIQGALLSALEECYRLHHARGAEPILEAFRRASSYVEGRRVVIEDIPAGQAVPTRGVTAGLDGNGALLLRAEDGTVAPVLAGSVRPEPGRM